MRETGKDIAEFLEDYLKKIGKTITDMSREIGMNKEVIAMWKIRKTTSPRADILIAISKYTGLTVSEILGQKELRLTPYVSKIAKLSKNLSESEQRAVLAVAETFCKLHEEENESVG